MSIFSLHNKYNEDWIIDLISTGNNNFTGNRIKKTMGHIRKERVILTYGEGLSNININKLLEFYLEHKKLATLTAVGPTVRFWKYALMEVILQNLRKNQ